jgi:hypothetical protein
MHRLFRHFEVRRRWPGGSDPARMQISVASLAAKVTEDLGGFAPSAMAPAAMRC